MILQFLKFCLTFSFVWIMHLVFFVFRISSKPTRNVHSNSTKRWPCPSFPIAFPTSTSRPTCWRLWKSFLNLLLFWSDKGEFMFSETTGNSAKLCKCHMNTKIILSAFFCQLPIFFFFFGYFQSNELFLLNVPSWFKNLKFI